MGRKSTLELASKEIISFFKNRPENIFSYTHLQRLVSSNREKWFLAKSISLRKVINFLAEKGKLKIHNFSFPHQDEHRYTWGDVSSYAIVNSLRDKGYFSHYSAIFLHDLTEQVPKTLYYNIEQVKHVRGGGGLVQGRIASAFKRKPRQTNNIAEMGAYRVLQLNGKFTKRLGVLEIEGPDGEFVFVTDLERTLIDAVVRPVYSGGIYEVAKAYRNAAETLSINRMAAYLRRLDYVYPYHQCIGFLLEYAGNYSSEAINIFRQFPRDYDFYLTHQMEDPEYNKDWRLFIPKGL